jgi:hypothetical protein
LQRRHDGRRTWRTAVVDRIPAVPARSTGAHLCDPGPYPLRWCVNRDRVRRNEDWVPTDPAASLADDSFRGTAVALRDVALHAHDVV